MTLHPQSVAALDLWSAGPSVADPGFDLAAVHAQRALALREAAGEDREDVASVVEVDAAGVPSRLYRPLQPRTPGALVYAHGGGFVFGDLVTHDAQARRLANRTGASVLAVGYRRPPEHRFPAAHDDVSAAARWLAAEADGLGIDASALVAIGDSAGASLALGAALRDAKLFAGIVLVYPFIDPRRRGGSFVTETNHGLSAEEARWYWQSYAGPEHCDGATVEESLLADPEFCPLDSAYLGILPPTLILVAEHDVLHDEAVLLHERITAAGGVSAVEHFPGMIHGFWRHPSLFDAAEDAYARTTAFLRPLLNLGDGVNGP